MQTPQPTQEQLHQRLYENRENAGVKAIMTIIENTCGNAIQIVCDDQRTDKEHNYAGGALRIMRDLSAVIEHMRTTQPQD